MAENGKVVMARRGFGLFYVLFGFGLYQAAKFAELVGDVAPEGSGERLGYHLLALVVLLMALTLFVMGGIAAFRTFTGRKSKASANVVRVFADEPGDPSAFDPDAALARYLKNRTSEAQPLSDPVPARPQGAAFGRKSV
jgi:hypothetical protein